MDLCERSVIIPGDWVYHRLWDQEVIDLGGGDGESVGVVGGGRVEAWRGGGAGGDNGQDLKARYLI